MLFQRFAENQEDQTRRLQVTAAKGELSSHNRVNRPRRALAACGAHGRGVSNHCGNQGWLYSNREPFGGKYIAGQDPGHRQTLLSAPMSRPRSVWLHKPISTTGKVDRRWRLPVYAKQEPCGDQSALGPGS